MTAPTTCGHQWAAGPSSTDSSNIDPPIDPPIIDASAPHEHVCLRVSPDHRAHECGCSEVELRTLPYQLGARRTEITVVTTSGGY